MSERQSISIRDRHGFERCVPVSRPVTIGRHSQCDIVLSDSKVSRTHQKVERVDGQWWVEDLGSSHGTYQGEDRVARTPWEAGATLRLADGFQRVSLAGNAQRGGLLGMAGVLTVSANGVETSPVTRGVWVSENILGIRPPPPPDVVPAIEPGSGACHAAPTRRLPRRGTSVLRTISPKKTALVARSSPSSSSRRPSAARSMSAT